MKPFKVYYINKIIVCMTALFILTCSKKAGQDSGEKILAKIDDKIITVDQFIDRVELTPHPVISAENEKQRKAVLLNNLIIEKMLALEAEDSSPLRNNKNFQAYLKGIQEQAMREHLFYQEAYNQVKTENNKDVQKKADLLWQQYIKKVMADKKLIFKNETFIKVSQLFYDLRTKAGESSNGSIAKQGLNNKELEKNMQELNNILHQPFFRIENKVWTVEDFKNALMSHSLVYRKKHISESEFPQQFKYAVADLVRDLYLNREAYKRSLDEHPEVQRTVEMWKDAHIAEFLKNQIQPTTAKNKPDTSSLIDKHEYFLTAYADSVYRKYEQSIEVNLQALKNVQLTKIPLFALQQYVPYPAAVPPFPMWINDNKLRYGESMNK
ncbi:MAG: hypothetical protein R6V04_04205 [bacterium]